MLQTRKCFHEFEKRFNETPNVFSIAFHNEFLIFYIQFSMKPALFVWDYFSSSREHKLRAKFLTFAMLGDSKNVEKMKRIVTNEDLKYATIIAGIMRHDDMFSMLCEFHLGSMESRVLSFAAIANDILLNDEEEEKPTRAHMRVAVYWRCWSEVGRFLEMKKVDRLTSADFTVTRAARAIQRAWRERRRRYESLKISAKQTS